jgi:hypothetical protein
MGALQRSSMHSLPLFCARNMLKPYSKLSSLSTMKRLRYMEASKLDQYIRAKAVNGSWAGSKS